MPRHRTMLPLSWNSPIVHTPILRGRAFRRRSIHPATTRDPRSRLPLPARQGGSRKGGGPVHGPGRGFTLYLTIMQRERREVVVTGVGLCCHMGSDLERIERELRAGQNTPFQTYDEAVLYGARCQIMGIYPDSLDPESLGIAKGEARFMGRASFMAVKAARIAIQQSRIDPTPLGGAIGRGT